MNGITINFGLQIGRHGLIDMKAVSLESELQKLVDIYEVSGIVETFSSIVW